MLSLPHVLTLERFKRVHEVQIGLQWNQPRLNHVRISQMCCKNQRGDRGLTLPSQTKSKGLEWIFLACSHSRFFQGEM